MTSSEKEILEPLESLIKKGLVGFDPGTKTEKYNVVYDKLATMIEVFTPLEIENLPSSKNMKLAIKSGCKTDEEIISYCKSISQKALENAKRNNKPEKYDNTSLLICRCEDVECNWDYVNIYINPEGEILYERKHTY